MRFLRPILDTDLDQHTTSSAGSNGSSASSSGNGNGSTGSTGSGNGSAGSGSNGSSASGSERRAMARLVRRRMLLALKHAPPSAGAPLTRWQVID